MAGCVQAPCWWVSTPPGQALPCSWLCSQWSVKECLRGACVSFPSLEEQLRKTSLNDGQFILDYGVRGFSLWLAGFTTLGWK